MFDDFPDKPELPLGEVADQYIRAASLIPLQVGERKSNQNDLSDLELHAFCPPGSSAALDYTFDDGHSLAYRRGKQSRVRFEAEAKGDTLRVRAHAEENGAGPLEVRFVLHAPLATLVYDDGRSEQRLPLRGAKARLTGEPLSVRVSRVVRVGG